LCFEHIHDIAADAAGYREQLRLAGRKCSAEIFFNGSGIILPCVDLAVYRSNNPRFVLCMVCFV
jgi:hypothetical protein